MKLNGLVVSAAPAFVQVLPPFVLYWNWTFFKPVPPVSEAVALSVGLLFFVNEPSAGAVRATFRVSLPIVNETT